MTNLSQANRKVVKALKRDRDDRGYEANNELVKYFSNVNIFAKNGIDGNDLLKVINSMYYQFFPQKSVIFRYGDEGDVFYIIISGKVQVWLPNPEIEASKYARKDMEVEL